jgi:hypothetical protein
VGGSEYGAGPPACGRQALSAGKSTADYDCRDAGRPVRSTEHRALGTAVERGNPGCAWHRASARPGALGVVALERVLGAWVRGDAPAGHVAIDGKRLRGSATAASPGMHLLAAFSTGLEGVIGQLRVDPAANEITAALEMLKTLPLQGTIVTGDAIFTQKAICRAIVDGGGDYFSTVKANQPALKADIEQAFRPFSPLNAVDASARPGTGGNHREKSRPDRNAPDRDDRLIA